MLGPNGAGKTTTLAMLTGFIPPSRGRLCVSQKEIRAGNAALEGFCPQHTALWPGASAREHLVLLGRLRGMDEVGGEEGNYVLTL